MEQTKLNKILENHKLWLETNGEQGERANLSNAKLWYTDFSYANLRSANLSYADLSNADLRNANLRSANLSYADLSNADLRNANLRSTNLRSANLDFSCFPLWCGGLDVHIDDKQAVQLLYHLVSNVKFSKNTSDEMKKLLLTDEIIKKANEFHRIKECGKITED